MSKPLISIIIPVYKNYQMFYGYFKKNKQYFNDCEVIVMNDYPLENITEQIKEIYPPSIIINNNYNLGFAGNVNKGIKIAQGYYVFLMNSDVVLKDESFKKSVDFFKKNKKLFAVAFAQKDKDGSLVGANYGYFKDGLINHSKKIVVNNKKQTKLTPNFWAEGGSSIYDKKKFIELGLFDEIYNPFYWEDVDLSYRALKSGYDVMFDSSVIVNHQHESTIGKYFNQSKILKTAFRNQLIFQWKNLTDRQLIFNHLLHIIRFIFIPGFFDALIKLPSVLNSRRKTVKLFIKKDREILKKYV